MLSISPITRPDKFLNEELPFVNTVGSMDFALSSPSLLRVDVYQRTLRRLILTLKNLENRRFQSTRQEPTPFSAEASMMAIPLGAQGYILVDASPNLPCLTYPFIFVAYSDPWSLSPPSTPPTGSQPPTLTMSHNADSSLDSNSNDNKVLYHLRLPLDPTVDRIQCQLSARRLCSRHAQVLDRILRRLCDACPGAFSMSYSDGLSGVEAGQHIVYLGVTPSSPPGLAPPVNIEREINQGYFPPQERPSQEDTLQRPVDSNKEPEMGAVGEMVGQAGYTFHQGYVSPMSPPRFGFGWTNKMLMSPSEERQGMEEEAPVPAMNRTQGRDQLVEFSQIQTQPQPEQPGIQDWKDIVGRRFASEREREQELGVQKQIQKEVIEPQKRTRGEDEEEGDGVTGQVKALWDDETLWHDYGLLEDSEMFTDVRVMWEMEDLHDRLWVH
ncbi:hypothetical protein BGW38_002159 [Lunasporangiospora selenospora]|uniref:Uncharacterized protein n=1 Tax=Lunasporangiospora selenospora TaxID=979761 RepID=A0A9P6FUL0_9FUNG|nr:hypothetical protein BGW38_002159 [Lunasporangiospora selenospora]